MKSQLHFIFIVLGIVFGSEAAFGQTSSAFQLKGLVVDSVSRKPIEFATISILDGDKKVVALTYSDESGVFKSSDVSTGSYFLNLTFVGYGQRSVAFTVGTQATKDFGTILMKPDVTQLEAVTITGTRALVEQQPGMLIYNAEKDISNQGGTAADVLRKAPILNVDAAGNVSMRGNSNIRILINGKYSGQMARSAADALNMMPAGSIKSVEVITSPSARYDAEGAAGVINIITKKGQQSTSGTIEGVLGNMEQAFNPRIALNREKWNISSTLHTHRLQSKERSQLNRQANMGSVNSGGLVQDIISDNVKPHGSGDLQIEFMPDSVSTFNFSVNGWVGNWPDNSQQHTKSFDGSGIITNESFQSVKTKSLSRGVDLNLGYTRKFRKPGEELYLMAQHNRGDEDYDYRSRQIDPEQLLLYRETNDNRGFNREWTLQADYVLPLDKTGKHALESGAKAILRNVGSRYAVSASDAENTDLLVLVTSRTDQFDYKQDVYAAYSQVKLKWNTGWAVHAGARMEGTYLQGDQHQAAIHFKNDFWNFVPSATLFKKLNGNNNLTLSFTRRISRPSIWDLNPNKDMQNPSNIQVGNPELRPEQVNQVEFTYALQTDKDFFFNSSLFARRTNNSIESVVTIDQLGTATTTKQNLASNAQYGVNFSTAVNLTPGWKVNGNANARFARFSSGALNISNEGMAWGVNLNSSWKLPNQFSLQAYGDYDAREVTLQGYETAWFYYSFSAKKEIPSKNLTISLVAANPFTNYTAQKEVVNAAGFTSAFTNRYMLRTIRLSLSWEFGGTFKGANGRKISNDDLKNVKSGG